MYVVYDVVAVTTLCYQVQVTSHRRAKLSCMKCSHKTSTNTRISMILLPLNGICKVLSLHRQISYFLY